MRILLVFVFLWIFVDGALFSWLFKKEKVDQVESEPARPSAVPKQEDGEGMSSNTDVILAAKIPFETKLSDEKFLMEAAKYTSLQLSELDVCHHKVILGLQTTCADLTEEELAKVAVNLLNCQSFAEGRRVFPCTSAMTLAECTKEMDPNTWNAYHIVSNRARAVCYAARQEQFRAKTELTVNKLMDTADEQIRSMNDLQESQDALGKATSKTFESLNSGHENLQRQQLQLSAAQQTVQNYVSSNLRELYKEKRLIASGQRELAQITESIKKKLDEAKSQLTVQGESQKYVHHQILHDLSKIQEDAQKVWQKLDASTSHILEVHEQTIKQYGRLLRDLHDMNATVHDLMSVLHSTRGLVEDKLSWISKLVGGTDDTVQKVYCCILHAGYFLISMLAASFLQVPYLTRIVLVVLVPLNALSEIQNDSSLQFSTLTTLLAICVLVNLSVSLLLGIYQQRKSQLSIRNEVRHFLKHEMPETLTHSKVDVMNVLNGKESVNNFSIISSSKCPHDHGDDYSSDEEELLTSMTKHTDKSFLRRRVLEPSNCSSTKKDAIESAPTSQQKEGSLPKKDETSFQSFMDSVLSEKEKSISKVRRHLLSHLESPHLSSLNSSLPSRSRRNTPVRDTPSSSRSGTPSRSMTPKKLCIGVCKNGQLCRNAAAGDSKYCFRHEGTSQDSDY